VTTLDAALGALRALETSRWVGFDTETRPDGVGTPRYKPGLDPYLSAIRLMQLGTATDAYVLDTGLVDPTPWLWWIKTHADRLIVQNGRFDLAHLQQMGVFVARVWDTLIADQLLRAGERGGASLGDLSERYLGETMDKSLQASEWSRELSDDQWEYAGRDVTKLPRLREILAAKLKAQGMERIAQVEFLAVPAFAMLGRSGFVLDREQWASLTEAAESELEEAERQLHDVLPSPAQQMTLFGDGGPGLNLLSPSQVQQALAAMGIELASTDEHHLKALDHPVGTLLLKHREFATRLKMCFRPMPGFVHPVTGRVHAEYWQMAAASGRTASSNPNMQQVPREREIRQCFGVAPGHALVVADYSQIELRIVAEESGDERMIEAFRRGADIHRQTAALVTGKNPEEVTKAERQMAKAVNFGICYGMGASGLVAYAHDAYGVAMSQAEAETFRKRYFEAYAGVAKWHHRQLWRAKKHGGVRTRGGRWRPLPEPSVTKSTNSPVQGTGADILKAALGAVAPVAFARGWKLISEVHDEISLEVPEEAATDAQDFLTKTMVEAGRRYLRHVPVEAEANVGRTWADK
jgi:DNA polymerase-1